MPPMLKNRNKIICIGLLLLTPLCVFSQKVKQQNLPGYDKEKLHFGFSLGINKADFVINLANASTRPDSVLSVNNVPDWGFNLGIISDLRLHDYLTLRFLPALTFQSRNLEYRIHPTTSS